MGYKYFRFFVYFAATHSLLIACILFTDQTHPSGHHNSLGIFVLVYGFLAISILPLALAQDKSIYDIAYWPFLVPTLILDIVLSLQSTQPSLSFNLSWAVFVIWNAFFSAMFGSLLFSLILKFSQHRTSLGHENLTQESDPKTSKGLLDPHWYVRLPYDDE